VRNVGGGDAADHLGFELDQEKSREVNRGFVD